MKKKISYAQVGDNYDTKDPTKKLAQTAALKTAINLKKAGYKEITDTRGESAFVWSLGPGLPFIASVVESLGTKNLLADEVRKITGKTYYDVVAHDTVAAIINDLVTVGAKPISVHAFWAIENNNWLADKQRIKDLISGWKKAVDLSGATWVGGETSTLKGIIRLNTVDLGGSAVGIIDSQKKLITYRKLKAGDRIVLIKSNGINANGVSLARAVAKHLPKGYATKLPSGKVYGKALLAKTNIYAKAVQDLLDSNVDVHYISNITGHGLRKIMRAKKPFTYVIERIFSPQEIFTFIQDEANISDKEMYKTFNMGSDYAIFVPKKDVDKVRKILAKDGFESLEAGYIKKGVRKVILKPIGITFKGSSLDLR